MEDLPARPRPRTWTRSRSWRACPSRSCRVGPERTQTIVRTGRVADQVATSGDAPAGLTMSRRVLVVGAGGREHASPGRLVHGRRRSGRSSSRRATRAWPTSRSSHPCRPPTRGPWWPSRASIGSTSWSSGRRRRSWRASRTRCARTASPWSVRAPRRRASRAARRCREVALAAGVPMAAGATFRDPDAALAEARARDGRVVVKADGLAAGKGVTVCDDLATAEAAIRAAMVEGVFGEAGRTVVVEEVLEGPRGERHRPVRRDRGPGAARGARPQAPASTATRDPTPAAWARSRPSDRPGCSGGRRDPRPGPSADPRGARARVARRSGAPCSRA